MPVVLATDALFFLLLFAIASYAVYAAGRPHTLRPWRKLAKNRTAMVSLTIMSFYVLIALLDSLHFKPRLEQQGADAEAVYSSEVMSVLDWVFTPILEQQEKTYSSPFALYAYVKESTSVDGGTKHDYPKLKYAGRNLKDERDRFRNVAYVAAKGLVQGIVAGAVVIALFIFVRSTRRKTPFAASVRRLWRSDEGQAWRPVTATLTVLLIISFVCGNLAVEYHIFGTDKVGQDVFYQAIKSIRTGVIIGTLTTLIMLPFALLLGIAAGYFLGWVDDVIQYVYTTLNSIPGVLLIAAAVLMLYLYMNQRQEEFDSLAVRADTRLLLLCMILGITSWTGLCRLLRAETLKVKSMDYIAAAQVLGVSRSGILLGHVLPNVMHIVFITVALDFSALVLAEAVLSYINIGVDPTMYSWGNMINSARMEMAREPIVWWSLAAALVFMFVLVLCANLFADAVRDAFDPYFAK